MQWDPALECGVEQIDNEHKELFRMVENLLEDAKAGKTVESSETALDFLEKYVANHFAHEEALMRECDYPHAGEHKELHNNFVKVLLNLKKKYEENDGSLSVAIEINHAAMSWLINHIKVIDMRFTQYYLENAQ